MNYEYAKTRDGVFVRIKQRLVKRKKHEQVDKELKLENEVEILEEQIKEKQAELKDENHFELVGFILTNLILMLVGFALGIPNILALPFIFLMSILCCLGGVYTLKNPFKVIRNRKTIKLQLEHLNRSLNVTKDKLEALNVSKNRSDDTLRKEKFDMTPVDVIDLTAFNNDYRQRLQQELEFLSHYKDLRKRFKQGTLEQSMTGTFSLEQIDYISECLGEERKRRK